MPEFRINSNRNAVLSLMNAEIAERAIFRIIGAIKNG